MTQYEPGHDFWGDDDDDDVLTLNLPREALPPVPKSSRVPARSRSVDTLREWHVLESGQQFGPLSRTSLREMLKRGAISERSLVWRLGLPDWWPLAEFPELVALSIPGPPSVADVAPALEPDEIAADWCRSGIRFRPRRSLLPWIAMILSTAAGLGIAYVAFGGG